MATHVLIVLTVTAVSVTGWGVLCRALPEPAPGPDGTPPEGRTPGSAKTRYADLSTPPWMAAIAIAACAGTWAGLALPHPWWPVWAVMLTGGLWQAGLDAGATWIPKSLAHATWAGLAIALLATAALSPATAAAAALGAALMALVVGGVWLVTRGGFGFGDVRFAPVLGAAAMAPLGEVGLFVVALGGLLTTLLWAVGDRLVTHQRRFIAWTPGWWTAAMAVAVLT